MKSDDNKDSEYAAQISRGFDAYVQARQDFIATVVEQSNAPPAEPMFFWGDVLRPFVQQYALLGTMLADQGFSYAYKNNPNKKSIKWEITLPDKDANIEPNDEEKERLYWINGQDTLVGIPGGPSGCHAFYAIMENILRNAVKNGHTDKEYLIIRIALEQKLDPHRYVLTIQTNLRENPAADQEGGKGGGADVLGGQRKVSEHEEAVRDKMRPVLNQSLHDSPEGKVETGHGMHEIRECAEFLSTEDVNIRFPSDERLLEDEMLADLDDPSYLTYLRSLSSYDHKGVRSQKDTVVRCFFDSVKGVAYQFVLSSPCLVGWCDLSTGKDADSADRSSGATNAVSFLRMVEGSGGIQKQLTRLTNMAPHVGVLQVGDMVSQGDDANELLKEIMKLDARLPFRLLLLCPASKKGEWETRVNGFDGDFFLNRLVVSDCNPYAEEHAGPNGSGQTTGSQDSSLQKEFRLCVKIYEAWLMAWRPNEAQTGRVEKGGGVDEGRQEPTPWGLKIEFAREKKSIEARWQNLKDVSSDWIKAKVYTKGNKTPVAISKGEHELAQAQTIFFQNHLEGLANYICHHNFGTTNISLCQRLEHPPESPDSLKWFLLALAESALLRVVIFDERVAEALREPHELDKWNSVKVFPVMRAINGMPEFAFENRPDFMAELSPQEGFDFSNDSANPLLVRHKEETKAAPPGERIDILALHRGMLEQAKEAGPSSSEALMNWARHVAARVVILSGRGGAGDYAKDFPFVEVSSLGSLHWDHFDKFRMGQVLLSRSLRDGK